jgi:hypothetical protein
MAKPIVVAYLFRAKDAWNQLSEEEQGRWLNQFEEGFNQAGIKTITNCFPAWAFSKWDAFRVVEFPDVETFTKGAFPPKQDGVPPYWDTELVFVGEEAPPLGTG